MRNIEQGQLMELHPLKGNPESRESPITVDRIEPIDINRIRGLQTILRMLKENRSHLEGVTDATTIFDLNRYYSESGRHGFVGIDEREGLVGVYDLSGRGVTQEVTRTRRGAQNVVLAVGFLNRMCVRTDLQARGIGDQLTKDAIRRAHGRGRDEYGWSNLLAGIVLEAADSQRVESARINLPDERMRETVYQDIFNELKEKDPRVKLFVVRNGFQYSGFGANVLVGIEPRNVLLISHHQPRPTTVQGNMA